ncbi:OadG-related small transporter subunit [Candidatus Hecatella orcuttiae]|uniref:OadG-related small transporter subunit n=1 Tax=Candidatus Hecatella orcuttiae TaxID=1935119 RepID=UPI00286821DC|nr:OadG-related small transporter subunit [Candidatus Hecatella orcuttiae]
MDWNFALRIMSSGLSAVFITLFLLYLVMKAVEKIFSKLEAPAAPPELEAGEVVVDMKEIAAITGAIYAYLEGKEKTPSSSALDRR